MEKGLVLHQRHLRHADHAALHTAAEECDEVVPVFVFDPAFYQGDNLACDARIKFLHECLRDIDVSLFHGKPTEVFSDFEGPVYTMHSPSGRYGQERNERLYQAGATFIDGDGLRRVEHSRDGWSDAVQDWLDNKQYDTPDNVTLIESDVTIDLIEDEYDIDPVKENVPRGGREAALDQLDQFCNSPEYWGHISEPTRERGLSGLSPYLRFGCLSLREVYQRARERLDGRDWNAFQSRLFWNLHYNQKLLDWPGWMERAVNPALRELGTFNKELWEAFKSGETGYPMVDAAVLYNKICI